MGVFVLTCYVVMCKVYILSQNSQFVRIKMEYWLSLFHFEI